MVDQKLVCQQLTEVLKCPSWGKKQSQKHALLKIYVNEFIHLNELPLS